MKKKYAVFIFAVALAMTSISGCSKSNSEETSGTTTEEVEDSSTNDTSTDDTEVYGEVTNITDSVITIDVGTLNQNELELTGESMEITVTDDTVFYSQGMGGGMNGGGDMPDGDGDFGDGEAADGDAADGEAPDMPDGGNMPDSEAGGSTDSDGDAPGMPDGEAGGGDVPEKPDGEGDSDGDVPEKPDGDDGNVPSMPDGDDGNVPSMPDGDDTNNNAREMTIDSDSNNTDASTEKEEIELSDISVGDTISVTFDDAGSAEEITVITVGGMADMNDGGDISSMGGTSSGVDSYTAVTEYSSDTEIDGKDYSSTGTDENAILVSGGATVTLDNITVTRDSDDSTGGDNSSFYGVGAAILATDGTAYIDNADISTDAAGGAGVFAYGDGTVYVSDSTITTTRDTSGGIHAAGGGTLYAWDLNVETNGESAAAIRSDRGGGTIVVDGGTYTSNGTGSPAVYSTADITINGATLTATGSEAVCIEGLNSLRLYDSDLTGSMKDDSQNDCTWNVILYQSMSGDSEVGNSSFEMQGGSLTAKNGGMFYTTNTESTFTISDVDITYASDSEFFLKCTGNSNERGWGTSGSNGADCLFTAINQEMEGLVIWDTISKLDFYITEGSTLTGSIEDDESNAGSGGNGYCNVYIDEGSKWIVTGDSLLTTLYCEGTIVDEDGNTVTIQGSDGTVYVSGSSNCVITVETYEDTVDVSGASSLSSWSDYEVEESYDN